MHCVELGLTHVSLIFIDFSLQDAPDAEIIHTLSLYMRSERSVDFAGFRTVLPSVHCRRSKSTNFAEFLQSSGESAAILQYCRLRRRPVVSNFAN